MHDLRGRRSRFVAARRTPAIVLGTTVLATVLAAMMLAACGTRTPTPGPNLSGPPSVPGSLAPTEAPATAATPTAPPATTTSTAPACAAADLKASHGLVEGAAGSRLTEVVLVAAVICSIDAAPILGLRDATGAAIVGGVATGSGRIDLSPEGAYTSAVRFANWCNPEPAFPLELTIRLGGEELAVTGGSFPDEETGMPPCNGESVAPTLEGGAWIPGA